LNAVEHIAFENPDGSKTLVVTNTGLERDASVRLASASAEVKLAPDSLTTLVWN